MRLIPALLLTSLLLSVSNAEGGDEARAAVNRALPLLQRSAATFVDKRACFSCHHNGLSISTFRLADRHGLRVNRQVVEAVEAKTFGVLRSATSVDVAVQATTLSDPTPNDSLLLMAAHEAGLPGNLATGVLARRLSHWQRADGRWMTSDFRPPHSSSEFSATATAVAAIRAYLPVELAAERDSSLRRAAAWLAASWPHSTEDAAFRVMGLVWSDAPAETIAAATRVLLSMQLPNGGWPQLPAYVPDAYSTGEALYALRVAGVAASTRDWQRGARFLITSQALDGSWHVRSRLVSPADVSPPYFHTGFPYGDRDEFLSYAGSCWAVMALVSSLPDAPPSIPAAVQRVLSASSRGPDPSTGSGSSRAQSRDDTARATEDFGDSRTADNSDAPSWLRIALFGTARELSAALDAGLDPNSSTPGGTTMLMASALDADKVRLLLSRRADPKVRSQSRVDALTIAASHLGTSGAVTALLDAGAEAEPPEGVRVRRTPLTAAALAGDLVNVELLLKRGAKISGQAVSEALTFGHTDVVRTLVAAGADVTGVDSTGINLLHWSAITNRASMIPILVKAGVPINAIDDFGYTPLMYAATVDEGDVETLSALLAAGANASLRDDAGRTPLQQARRFRHAEIVRVLSGVNAGGGGSGSGSR